VTRRRRPRFTRGTRRRGAAASAASFGRKPYGAAAAAHGSPGDRPPVVPAVSCCRARSTMIRLSPLRQARREPLRSRSQRAGTMPRIVRAGRSSLNGASHPADAGRACGAPLIWRPLPAQQALTARAKLKARPDWRAANHRRPLSPRSLDTRRNTLFARNLKLLKTISECYMAGVIEA
jgi:hypothetical protein